MKLRSQGVLGGLAWLVAAVPGASGQGTPPPSIVPRTEAVASTSGSAAGIAARAGLAPVASGSAPRAIPRATGVAAPGARVRLDGTPSSGGQVWYRWVQTAGPRVTLAGADQAVAQFTVPKDAAALEFILVVGNNGGVDARPLSVPIESAEADTGGEALPLQADAGPDQAGVVGQKVVLDGSKSEPKGKIRCRWVQTGGPQVADLEAHDAGCSFVPAHPGAYQFALLVVGADDLVSEAALVRVQVKPATAAKATGAPAADRPPLALDELAQGAVAAIPGGGRLADDLARSFDLTADRIDAFKTYLDAASELTRRLDAVIPREPGRREPYVERLLKPWNARLAEVAREQGLALDQPAGQRKPLTKPQRAYLAQSLRLTAAGLRAGLSLR